jgi:hypothetical protein
MLKSKAERQKWWNSKTDQEKEIQLSIWMLKRKKRHEKPSDTYRLIGITFPSILETTNRPQNIAPWD